MVKDDIIEHTGTLGMKWGHRKASGWTSKNNTKTSDGKHPFKSVKDVLAKLSTKKVSSIPKSKSRMTDLELRSRINRIELEQKYALLTKPKMSAGKKMIMDIIQNAGKQTATAYVAKMMGKAVEDLAKKTMAKA